ncbi:hypothetical protein FHW69_001644 [Luteibacter sp. Sphag1AF]|uniref:ERF family protein n=1 Tax=Luteibacter sp. Sphag1AF TaxID=2587031 RepID=UPI00160A81CB|nr:ERF family protein [Luteibacter sp. Sphag1AF]MBB3227043.1 hypothetical protein [Luteibacter sp. Sphag1AF]
MNLQSEKIEVIVPALIKARASFKAAVKDASNPHFKSQYVTLDGVVESVNQALLDSGIFCTQQTDVVDGRTVLYTRFLHESGQWIGSAYPVHPIKNDPQAEGSALTYARRYALMALAGIAPEDDDGNAASRSSSKSNHDKQARDIAGTPTAGAWESMSEEEQVFLSDIAIHAAELLSNDDALAAHDHIQSQNLASEEKIALWTRFDSKQRSALKRADAASKTKKEAA